MLLFCCFWLFVASFTLFRITYIGTRYVSDSSNVQLNLAHRLDLFNLLIFVCWSKLWCRCDSIIPRFYYTLGNNVSLDFKSLICSLRTASIQFTPGTEGGVPLAWQSWHLLKNCVIRLRPLNKRLTGRSTRPVSWPISPRLSTVWRHGHPHPFTSPGGVYTPRTRGHMPHASRSVRTCLPIEYQNCNWKIEVKTLWSCQCDRIQGMTVIGKSFYVDFVSRAVM